MRSPHTRTRQGRGFFRRLFELVAHLQRRMPGDTIAKSPRYRRMAQWANDSLACEFFRPPPDPLLGRRRDISGWQQERPGSARA